MLKTVKRVWAARSGLVLALGMLAATAAMATAARAAESKAQPGGASPSLGLAQPIILNAPEAAPTVQPGEGAPAAPAETAAVDAAEETVGEGLAWPTFSADVSFNSKYVWRGLLLTDGAVMQPSATVAWYGFSFNIWGNLDMTSVNGNGGEFNEVDYTLDYTTEIYGPLSASVGFIFYDFPNTAFDSTYEVYVGASLEAFLSPSLTAYFDIDEIDGVYVQGSIGHSFALPEICEGVSASVDLGATVGWGSGDYCKGYFGNSGGSALTDYSLSLSVPVAIGEHVTVTPGVTWTSIAADGLRKRVAEDDNIVYGINIAVSF